MAKLADYIACSLIYHKGNKFEIDEERTIMPCVYEDSDEYIKEYWGDNEFIGKFPVTYKGKEVQVLVFKDYEVSEDKDESSWSCSCKDSIMFDELLITESEMES